MSSFSLWSNLTSWQSSILSISTCLVAYGFEDCSFVFALDTLNIFYQFVVLTVPNFQIGSLQDLFFLFWFLPLQLLVTVSATPLLCLCQSIPCFFFPPTCPLSYLHFTETMLKMSFLPLLLAFPKRSYCGARAVAWEPLLYASCWFLFSLLLSFSLVFLFPEYLSNTSPLPATDTSVPLCPSTRHQWDSWFFFSLPVSCSCIPAYLHSLCCWQIGSSTCPVY